MQSSAAGNPDRFIVHPGSFDYHAVLFVNILSLSHKKSIQTLHFFVDISHFLLFSFLPIRFRLHILFLQTFL